jgi:hypothetical protein
MPIAIPKIPSLAAGATFADPKLDRPLAPKEPPARDYGGYTDLDIPTVTWPGGKSVALNISIHFEEGAEATVSAYYPSLGISAHHRFSQKTMTSIPKCSWAR